MKQGDALEQREFAAVFFALRHHVTAQMHPERQSRLTLTA